MSSYSSRARDTVEARRRNVFWAGLATHPAGVGRARSANWQPVSPRTRSVPLTRGWRPSPTGGK
jgi:hypothetical protein